MERAEVNIFINNYLFRINYIQQQQQQQQPSHSGDVPFAHGDAILSTSRHHPTAGGGGVMLSPWEGATTHTQLSRPMPSGHHIAWSTDYGGNHIGFNVTSHIRSSIR